MTIPPVADGAQRAGWGATVGTAVALQWAVVLGVAAVAWLWGGTRAMSALGGGASVALPNTMLAGWLTLRVYRAGGAGAATMLAGELAKLGMTVALLVLMVKASGAVSWLALIAGVIGALKAQWLALWFTRNI